MNADRHERCECGHCRCEHAAGYAACCCCECDRYTWPGSGAELPADHATTAPGQGHGRRGERLPARGRARRRNSAKKRS